MSEPVTVDPAPPTRRSTTYLEQPSLAYAEWGSRPWISRCTGIGPLVQMLAFLRRAQASHPLRSSDSGQAEATENQGRCAIATGTIVECDAIQPSRPAVLPYPLAFLLHPFPSCLLEHLHFLLTSSLHRVLFSPPPSLVCSSTSTPLRLLPHRRRSASCTLIKPFSALAIAPPFLFRMGGRLEIGDSRYSQGLHLNNMRPTTG